MLSADQIPASALPTSSLGAEMSRTNVMSKRAMRKCAMKTASAWKKLYPYPVEPHHVDRCSCPAVSW